MTTLAIVFSVIFLFSVTVLTFSPFFVLRRGVKAEISTVALLYSTVGIIVGGIAIHFNIVHGNKGYGIWTRPMEGDVVCALALTLFLINLGMRIMQRRSRKRLKNLSAIRIPAAFYGISSLVCLLMVGVPFLFTPMTAFSLGYCLGLPMMFGALFAFIQHMSIQY